MKSVLKYYVRLVMLIMPMVFLPVVTDPFGWGKNWIWVMSGFLGLFLWLMGWLTAKEKKLELNELWWWWGGMVVVAMITWWKLSSGAKIRTMADFGGLGTMVSWWVWMFLWQQTKEDREGQIGWMTIGAGIVGVASIGVFLLPTTKLPLIWPKTNPFVSIDQNWSMAGSLLNEVLLMGFLATVWMRKLVGKLKNDQEYVGTAVVSSLLILILLLGVFRLIKTGWINLDGTSSWVIAVESFKKEPLLGVGVGNFVEAFSSWRPTSYNATSYWANGFKFSGNLVLHIWTEMGLLGLGLVVIMAVRLFKKRNRSFEWWFLMGYGLAVLFLPYTFLGTWLLVWLLSGLRGKTTELSLLVLAGDKNVNMAPVLVTMVVMTIGLVGGYTGQRLIAGEIFMRQSLLAASKNDGGSTYNLQIRAIGSQPQLAEYRRIYSQTNLSLAIAMLSNKDLSDEDKQKASVLIQQAVREAKSAISLESNNPIYWSNLASIYRQIVGIVDGAADWSLQAYQQAVILEPVNPMTKLEMGGLLFAAGRYEDADRVFEALVVSKSDMANGWYNWAYTAKKLNKLPEAISRLTQATSLVPVDSVDYDKATKELADWKKELEDKNKKEAVVKEENKAPEVLQTPAPLPTGKAGVIPVPTGELNPPSVGTPTLQPTRSN